MAVINNIDEWHKAVERQNLEILRWPLKNEHVLLEALEKDSLFRVGSFNTASGAGYLFATHEDYKITLKVKIFD